ncbi:heavy-metal-associated domain-containing protein [Moorella sp. Hama-1]|uniref:heavy-metal-associated domain-containing protein n=1 Tax=Moorella sp. Hama-1 TaxID=2138101 RepID=UPI000D647ABF|nr:heavy-metal-associated domain-containing protein [Moorella sp. Hama-1]MDN5361879.1 hypothetical protein [Moorella sp. (in: firmicutes)]BCV21409.1 hypothetical protein hamaS1_14780 [Moorella sp. Hama-1]
MSWYSQKAREALAGKQFHELQSGYSPQIRQVTMTLIVTDMKTEEDCKKIGNTLRNLPGVVSVNIIPRHRRVTVTYNLPQINLETIGYHITKLGYRYIQKA